MAKNTQDTNAQISGNVLFYGNPQPLSKDKHGTYGVKAVDKPFAFMEKNHFVPLTAREFSAATGSYPIIFAGSNYAPLAVMGVRQEDNLFVNDGVFNPDFYLPAFARRYPFVLAGDENNDRFIVCIDEDADCIAKEKPTTMFFEGEEASKFTKDAFEFLQAFERDRQATDSMVNRFKELDLFEKKEMNFQGQNPDGSAAQPQKIADYFAVSAAKMAELDDKLLAEFTKNGYLAAAYAHIFSLSNWQRLVNITLRNAQAQAAA